VLIADVQAPSATSGPDHLRRDLEATDPETLVEIISAVNRLGLRVTHYQDPSALASRAAHHADDIVLTVFGGAFSRSRMALVPAICETFCLTYVGPDTYGRSLAQDKAISKALAREAGLRTPRHRVVRSTDDIPAISTFPTPYVVKPLWEGTSIGIGPDSLVRDGSHAAETISTLMAELRAPLLVEEFIKGREVNWCFVDTPTERLRSFAELKLPHDPGYFERHLYDAALKTSSQEPSVHVIDGALPMEDARSLERLLQFMGPVGYGRVDGKLCNGSFVFLEINPDAWLGPAGVLAKAFLAKGISYEDLLFRILSSARRSPRYR